MCDHDLDINEFMLYIKKDEQERQRICARAYQRKHKDSVNKYHSEYSKEKWECECGCIITRGSKYTHLKSKKHANLINKKNLNN
jgi:hypothetical protein